MNNKQIVERAFQDFKDYVIEPKMERYLRLYCDKMIRLAIDARWNPFEKGHNYTGNLINSIVIVLVRRRDNARVPYYAADYLNKPAIARKMSARTTKGGKTKNWVKFNPDWEGGNWSKYKPEVETNRGYGVTDAQNFAMQYMPTLQADYVVCLAYTTEYANWVEQQRKTTGYLDTVRGMKKIGQWWVSEMAMDNIRVNG